MSVHFLMNLLNELGKRARMLESIYHMTNTFKPDFWRKKTCYVRNVVMDVITFSVNL